MNDQEMPAPGRPEKYSTEPASYMRRGTRLQGRRQVAWDEYAADYVIDVPRENSDTSVRSDYTFDASAHFGRTAELVVEIGSGLGEAIVFMAESEPHKDFLAIEVYKPGLASTLGRIAAKGLTNVRVVEANAAQVLETMLPEASISELCLFFPDPWHKTRHNKRRLVRDSFMPVAARAIKPGGIWHLATDWEDYADQMVDVLDRSAVFRNVHEGWAPRYEGRVLTSFENKAHAAGREIFDLTYERV